MKKRIIAILLALILSCCLSGFALSDGSVTDPSVAWSDLVAEFNTSASSGSSVSHKGVTVQREEKDQYIISGQGAETVLQDVVIDSRDASTSFGAGSYTFSNLTLDGEFSVTSEGNNAYTLTLEQSVHAEDAAIELYAGKSISNGKHDPPTELHHGKIQATIYCQTASISAEAKYNSRLELYNHGKTGKIDARPYNNSHITLKNHGSIAVKNLENIVPAPDGFGTLLMEVDSNSSMDVINNSPHTQVLYAWAYQNSKLTVVNNGNSDRLNIDSEYNSDVHFTNNGTITNRRVDNGNEWGDDAVILRIDENSKLTLDGDSRILPGHQHYSYYANDGHLGGIDECSNKPDKPDGIPGPSVILNARNVDSDRIADDQLPSMILKIAKRITFNWDQIVTDERVPFPVVAVRRGSNGHFDETPVRTFIYPIQSKDTHPIPVHKKSNLDVSVAYGDNPILFTEDGAEGLFLRADDVRKTGNTVSYELSMVDAYNTKHDFNGTALVFIPYPDGMTRAQADGHEFELTHITESGTEVFSTRDSTLVRTESGVYAEVASLSPFELKWTSSHTALPKTGDSSHLMLVCAAFLLSSTALILRRKSCAA